MLRDQHGGYVYGRNIRLDFSANVNPLGMPESVRKAAKDAVDVSGCYPDHCCGELVKKIAGNENINEKNIVCGNGADDLIYRIVNAIRPRKAVIAVPTFSEYAKALTEADCDIAEYPLDEKNGFLLDDGIPDHLPDDVDMLILCNPNNPTGRLIGHDILVKIIRECENKNIIFLCDECFIGLAESCSNRTAKYGMNKNVIVLKAFTKTYAMAGLRLGYALFGSTELAARVRDSGQFWSVSAVAQAAGLAALDEYGYVEKARSIISEERRYLSDSLRGVGFTVYPSDANFILFRCRNRLDELLLNEGILIRSCAGFSGLGEGFFRVAVRLHDENEELVRTIGKVMKWQKQ